MVAEEKLVAKDYNRLRASGLTDDQVGAVMEVIAAESERVVTLVREQVAGIGQTIRPLLTEMIETEVSIAATEINGHFRIHLTEIDAERSAISRRMNVVEQKVETVRRSQPLPVSKFFDEGPSDKPRRRWGRFVLAGIAVAVLAPVALSLLAAGLKALLGLMLHLLS